MTPSSAPYAKTALVLAGGDPVVPALAAELPAFDIVIAADSGVYQARALGIAVDLAVGDFDSIEAEEVARLEPQAEIERHPAAKDKTDIELGLDAAVREGATSIVVVAGAGGRLDHALANLLVLAAPPYAKVGVSAFIGGARVQVIRGEEHMSGEPGSIVSLLALAGIARGVSTTGLRYGLQREDLAPGSTRGISNVLEGSVATVDIRSGVLLAIQPLSPEQSQEPNSLRDRTVS